MKQRFQQHILQEFLGALAKNIKDVFLFMLTLKSMNLLEEAMKTRYGEKEVQELGKRYKIGGDPPFVPCPPPFILSEELMVEWSDLRTHMILNSSSKTMADMLQVLSDCRSVLSTLYPNFKKLAQVCSLLPLSTVDCERTFQPCAE